MLSAIASLAETQPCSFLQAQAGTDAITISGLTGPDTPGTRAALEGAASGLKLDWRTRGADAMWCPTLDLLRAYGRGHLSVSLASGTRPLRDGEFIEPNIVGPGFAYYLRVDYFAHDGTVGHLFPPEGKPGVSKPAGSAMQIRDKNLVVGPPYGVDMIVAIASSRPLFSHARPDLVEQRNTYLAALRAALDSQAGANGQISIGVTLLDSEAAR